MCKAILTIICVSILALSLSGCAGLITATNSIECEFFLPYNDIPTPFLQKIPDWSTKVEFIKNWGTPDIIINSNSENSETWIYKRRRWCGLIPLIGPFLPVPLILPVCDGFDRIEFHGNDVTLLHTKGIYMKSYMAWDSGRLNIELFCQHPQTPNQGVESGAAKPATQVTP